jgi:uncharacterized membrane protein YedE/YeeE
MKAAKAFGFLIAGGVFGAGLSISGMTDPARVIGFLDVVGKWDPALLFVMAGAVAVYGLGMFILHKIQTGTLTPFQAKDPGCNLKLPTAGSSSIDRQLVIGAAIFGVGWGLGGFCPGPALANLGAFRLEALVFVPMMAIGMLFVQHFFGADR